jgi:hypothetical protein
MAVVALLLAAIALSAAPAKTGAAGCEAARAPASGPSGVIGHTIYGEGCASGWAGPGAARNDCTWPWDACTTVEVVALGTGLRIVVRPTMYCDCYTGKHPGERIIDLDPAMLAALGLNPDEGLWPVRVRPVSPSTGLPDTAMRP